MRVSRPLAVRMRASSDGARLGLGLAASALDHPAELAGAVVPRRLHAVRVPVTRLRSPLGVVHQRVHRREQQLREQRHHQACHRGLARGADHNGENTNMPASWIKALSSEIVVRMATKPPVFKPLSL